jgi:hypothetical protein
MAVESVQQQRVVAAMLFHPLSPIKRQHDDAGATDGKHGVVADLVLWGSKTRTPL